MDFAPFTGPIIFYHWWWTVILLDLVGLLRWPHIKADLNCKWRNTLFYHVWIKRAVCHRVWNLTCGTAAWRPQCLYLVVEFLPVFLPLTVRKQASGRVRRMHYPLAWLWWVTLTLEGCPYWMTCFTFVIVPCRAATSMAAYTTFALHFLLLTHPFHSLCSPYVNLAKCQFFYLFSPLWGIRKSTLRHFNFESDLIFPTCLHNRK